MSKKAFNRSRSRVDVIVPNESMLINPVVAVIVPVGVPSPDVTAYVKLFVDADKTVNVPLYAAIEAPDILT